MLCCCLLVFFEKNAIVDVNIARKQPNEFVRICTNFKNVLNFTNCNEF